MGEFFSRALAALPRAASSPASLVAYAMTLAAYVYCAVRVSRHRALLKHLSELPARDRLKALVLEIGEPRIRGGISPEQWLRSRIHRYYFLAFITTTICVVVLFLMVLKHREGSVDIDVTGYQSLATPRSGASGWSSLLVSQAEAAEFEFDANPRDPQHSGPYFVRYSYSRDGKKLTIRPGSDVLDAIDRGDVIEGAHYSRGQPFNWDFPVLSVKVANNTARTVLLSEVAIRVRSSAVDTRPVLVIQAPSYHGSFSFHNEGWGRVIGPALTMTVAHTDCQSDSTTASEQLGTFDVDAQIDIAKYVGDALKARVRECSDEITEICVGPLCDSDNGRRCLSAPPGVAKCSSVAPPVSVEQTQARLNAVNRYSQKKYRASDIVYRRKCRESPVCVRGELTYNDEDGRARHYRFNTSVYLGASTKHAAKPPSYSYDVFVKAGRAGYTERRPIAQEIKPGEVDHFLLRIATDRSASFDLVVDVNDSSGTLLWRGDLDLTAFVPRTGAALALRRLNHQ